MSARSFLFWGNNYRQDMADEQTTQLMDNSCLEGRASLPMSPFVSRTFRMGTLNRRLRL